MDATTIVLPDNATLAAWKHTDAGRETILRLTTLAAKSHQTRGELARASLAAMGPADGITDSGVTWPLVVALLMQWKGEG